MVMNTSTAAVSQGASTILRIALVSWLLGILPQTSAAEPDELYQGIPAAWWETHFGPGYASNPEATALADPDQDGANNYIEYATDTDPLDPGSQERHPVSVSTYAGSTQGWQDGPRAAALLNGPRDMAFDPQGRLWFTENGGIDTTLPSNRIRVVDAEGNVITISGDSQPGLVEGPLVQARFNQPQSPVFDSKGNAYIADIYNHRVRKIDTNGMVSTLAGTTAGYRNGPGDQAQFYSVQSICLDAQDNLYVADWDNICIRKVTPDGEVSLFAGIPHVRGAQDGPRLEATFETPGHMAFAPNGNLFVIDWANGLIRVVDTNGIVSTFASGISYAHRILIDAQANVYATYGVPGPITFLRKYRPDASIAWTVGGHDNVGFEDGPIANAKFRYAFSPVLLPNGEILISDLHNHRIRRIEMGVPAALTIQGPATFIRTANISISSIAPNADIRVTMDSADPTPASPRYEGQFSIYATTVVKARLFVQDTPVSEIVSATFTRLDTPGAPVILLQPYSQTVYAGDTVTLSVLADEPPHTYQWFRNGEPMEGATQDVLQLVDIQPEMAGDYHAVVTNPYGSATSDVATLTVLLRPTTLHVLDTSAGGGTEVTVLVELVSQGTENALGFSLACDPQVLTILDASLAPTAPPEAALVVNPNAIGAGRIGILVALPANATFPPGGQPLVQVRFQVGFVPYPTFTRLDFVGEPTQLQVSDTLANTLEAFYSPGFLSLSPGVAQFEADVAPRTQGDHNLTVTDWVQLGRFVAGLDAVQPGEFQRADCAPRASRGNGSISVTDWVQAGRYAGGLDPITVVGGPTEPGEAPLNLPAGTGGGIIGGSRVLLVPDREVGTASTFTIPVQLEALGDENAAGFSLTFDPARLALLEVTKGSAAATALLNVNTKRQASGNVGVALALPTGNLLSAGRQEIVRLTFRQLTATPADTTIAFGSNPVIAELSDAEALILPASYQSGTVTLGGAVQGPRLGLAQSGNNLLLFWPAAAIGFELYSATAVNGTWVRLNVSPILVDAQNLVILQLSDQARFYRLYKAP